MTCSRYQHIRNTAHNNNTNTIVVYTMLFFGCLRIGVHALLLVNCCCFCCIQECRRATVDDNRHAFGPAVQICSSLSLFCSQLVLVFCCFCSCSCCCSNFAINVCAL